jgi:hypothetical protein
MGSKRKSLNELNMEKKKEVLDSIDKGVSRQTTAVQFIVAKSTVGNIKTGAQYLRLGKKTAVMKGNKNYEELMRKLML